MRVRSPRVSKGSGWLRMALEALANGPRGEPIAEAP